MAEVKKETTIEEQCRILESRGCIIGDKNFCETVLSQVNYYRLTAYFLPFRDKQGNYKPGTTFETIYRIYEFDRKLRNIIFGAIEKIEIAFRAKLAHFHAMRYGPLGYLDPSNFNERHDVEKFQRNIDREIENNQNVPFIKHHIDNYEGQFPIWVISEIFTFGMLSFFYNDLQTQDKKELMGQQYRKVCGWLRCCTDLRNICAHYGRLYYRVFPASPAGLGLDEKEKTKLWGSVLALKMLYPDKDNWNCEVVPALEALFEQYSDAICLRHIAFPSNWAEQLLK